MVGGQATEPLPRIVGLLGADLHITPVDGKMHGSWGTADGPQSVDPVAIPPLAFCGTSTLGIACKQFCTLSRWTIHSFRFLRATAYML